MVEKKAFLWGLILIFSVLAFPCGVFAAPEGADPPVQITAEIGWGGQGVPGRTAPAVIHLKNTTADDLRGVTEVVNYHRYVPPPPPGSPPGPQPSGPARYYPVSSFGERVFLPAGGEKKVTLWFPLEGATNHLIVRFRTGEKTLARVEAKLAMTSAGVSGPLPMAVGVFGEIPPALEKVRITMPDGVPRAPLVLKLTPELLPPSGDQLDAFGLILVTGEAARNLTVEQRRALGDWVRTGGHLLLAGGPGVNDALAVLPAGAAKITSQGIAGNGDWRAAAGWLGKAPPAAAAPVARLQGGDPFGPEENPLGRQITVGEGKVTVFSFDPTRPPWDAGEAGRALWERLLQPGEPGSYKYNMVYRDPLYPFYGLMGTVNSLPAGAFPGWGEVGIFLGIFVLLAGPLTYWVLKRRHRPEYTWVAVPVLALLFSGIAYLYMLQTGRNVIVNVVQAVGETAEERAAGKKPLLTAVGFFAPTRPVFAAVLTDPGRPVQIQYAGGLPPELRKTDEEPPYSVVKGPDLTVTFREMSQYGMRQLSFRQDAGETLAGLRADLKLEGDRLAGKVRNDTALYLDHVTLILGDDYRGLGDLAPGEEKEVAMEIPAPPVYNPQNPYGPTNLPAWLLFVYPEGKEAALKAAGRPGVPAPRPDYGPPPRRLTVDEQRRANLLEQLFNSPRYRGPGMEFQRGWPLTLAAFSRDPVKAVEIKDLRSRPHYLSMVAIKPELSLPPGNFTIPAGLTLPEIIDAQIRGMTGHNNLFGIPGGNITFAFRPNLPPGARVKEITAELQYFPSTPTPNQPKGTFGPPSPSPADVESGALEIYHPPSGQWRELSGAKTFRLSGEYALPGGEVRLRVNGFEPSTGKSFYFLPPAVAYQGVRE
ncbi:MAG: hypothetical protein AB1556_17190 [Bacillota bacterium]